MTRPDPPPRPPPRTTTPPPSAAMRTNVLIVFLLTSFPPRGPFDMNDRLAINASAPDEPRLRSGDEAGGVRPAGGHEGAARPPPTGRTAAEGDQRRARREVGEESRIQG